MGVPLSALYSKSGQDCLWSYDFTSQPNTQEPGGEPGPSWAQQLVGILHPLLLPPANLWSISAHDKWVARLFPGRRAYCCTTDSHFIVNTAVDMSESPFWFSSMSTRSWLTLWDAHAVRHGVESDSTPKQSALVPLQEYQQLQPRPGQHTGFTWRRGAEDHREQGACVCVSVWWKQLNS